ncbi:hypothetical protein A2U01_0052741, partial [Trifolium medium]|nr:hypothetical protein [Trifolium medium]
MLNSTVADVAQSLLEQLE